MSRYARASQVKAPRASATFSAPATSTAAAQLHTADVMLWYRFTALGDTVWLAFGPDAASTPAAGVGAVGSVPVPAGTYLDLQVPAGEHYRYMSASGGTLTLYQADT